MNTFEGERRRQQREGRTWKKLMKGQWKERKTRGRGGERINSKDLQLGSTIIAFRRVDKSLASGLLIPPRTPHLLFSRVLFSTLAAALTP